MLLFTNTDRVAYQTFPVPDEPPANARWATPQEEALINSGVPLKWDSSGNVVERLQSEIDAEQKQQKRQRMTVSAFQAMAALENAGLLTQAETIVQGSDRVTQLAWNKAQSFRRLSPTITALAPQLGLNDDQLDQLFEQAQQIEA